LVIDTKEATIGSTNGENINILWHDTSNVMGKHRAGGQSSARFERGRKENLKRWFKKVAYTLQDLHKDRNIIIGGPGMTKDKFMQYLHPYQKDKVIEVKHAGYTDENGLWELTGISRYA